MKPYEITPDGVEFLRFIHALKEAQGDGDISLPTGLGEWQSLAQECLEVYRQGWAQSRSIAQEYVESLLYAHRHTHRRLDQLLSLAATIEQSPLDWDETPVPPLREEAIMDEEAGRCARQWLDAYIQWSQQWATRGHYLFHEGCGLWLLSTIAKRRIVIPVDNGKYTSLYIILAADTSKFTKTTTMNNATDLLYHLDLDFMLLPQKMTPEVFYRLASGYIPDDFASMPPQFQASLCRAVAFAAQLGWRYDEFGDQLRAMTQQTSVMRRFLPILLEWYDCPRRDDNYTIGRGNDHIVNPYLSLLAALTIDDIQSLPRSLNLWKNGLFARVAFLTPPEHEFSLALEPRTMKDFPEAICRPLIQFHERLGIPEASIQEILSPRQEPTGKFRAERSDLPQNICRVTEEVFNARDSYSMALGYLCNTSEDVPMELRGFYMRNADRAMRIAALLAWENNQGVIELAHWQAAWGIAERWRKAAHEFYRQTQNVPSAGARIEQAIMRQLHRHAKTGLSAIDITRRVQDLNSAETLKYLAAMMEAGKIYSCVVPGGKSGKRAITKYLPIEAELPEGAVLSVSH
jgi:hypothetical protein